MKTKKNILFGLYDDEQDLLKAVRVSNERGLKIMDVYSPFPIHGLDPLLGLKESRLHIAGFIFGTLGALTGFLFMSWIFKIDWPNVFGGKPYWPIPAFIPVTFELTVLFSGVGMVVTYFIINGLSMKAETEVLHDRISDDKFCIAFDVTGNASDNASTFESFLNETGATYVATKEMSDL